MKKITIYIEDDNDDLPKYPFSTYQLPDMNPPFTCEPCRNALLRGQPAICGCLFGTMTIQN